MTSSAPRASATRAGTTVTELRYVLPGSKEVLAGEPAVLPRAGDAVTLNKRKLSVCGVEFVVETCSGEADTVVYVYLKELGELT